MAPPCRLIHDRLNASLSWERSIVVDESVDREECASGDEELVEKRTDTSRSSEAILIMTVSCPILYSRYVLICGLFFSLVRPHPWIVNKRWVWRIQCQYYIVDERRANINILANLQYNIPSIRINTDHSIIPIEKRKTHSRLSERHSSLSFPLPSTTYYPPLRPFQACDSKMKIAKPRKEKAEECWEGRCCVKIGRGNRDVWEMRDASLSLEDVS